MGPNGLWYIGRLAQAAKLPSKTIRFYEAYGLLPRPQRTEAGYRLYPPTMVERITFIQRAQQLGLRLREVKDILDLSDVGVCPCGHVQKLLKEKLAELTARLLDFRRLRSRVWGALRRPSKAGITPRGIARCPKMAKEAYAISKRTAAPCPPSSR